MKPFIPCFALTLLYLRPAFGVESVNLPPVALEAVAIAGNAGAPTFTAQSVGATYALRARDFASGAVRNNVVYLRFDVSALKKTVLQTASITFNKTAGDTLTTGRFALYGLLDVTGNLSQNWTASSFAYGAEFDPSMFYDAFASSGVCPINLANVADFSTQEAVSGNAATLSSAAFVAFLQARANAGSSATLILAMPSQGAGNDKTLTYAFPGYTDPTLAPSLNITYAPVPLPSPPSHFTLEDHQLLRHTVTDLGLERDRWCHRVSRVPPGCDGNDAHARGHDDGSNVPRFQRRSLWHVLLFG